MIKNEKLLEEAMNHVANLHTVRMYDTTWDEYMELILRLGLEKQNPQGNN
jgi:hypothetical protein